MPHALIVDVDDATRDLMAEVVAEGGFTSATAGSLAEARAQLDQRVPALVIAGAELPDGPGRELFADARLATSCDCVLVGDNGAGAAHDADDEEVLSKPVDPEKLRAIVERVAATGDDDAPLQTDAAEMGFGRLIGRSPEMRKLFAAMARIAPTDATVLVIGESGTGKELVAHCLHELSSRAGGPYLAVNCGAVSPNLIESELFGHERGSFTGANRQHTGFFQRAHRGTLFLDEVTEMPPDLQVKLLRVLETRTVTRVGSTETFETDVRVIAATNRNPYEAVKSGHLREDLLYRLQVVPLHLPPLRERPGDVRLLALHFLAQLNAENGTRKVFSPSALERIERYGWPGNVRELYNVVQRAYILSEGKSITQPTLQRETMLQSIPPTTDGFQVRVGTSLADVERQLILHTVQRCRTQDEAARILGISTKTLYNKLRLYEARGGQRVTTTSAAARRSRGDATVQ